jgi:hypothetical protein
MNEYKPSSKVHNNLQQAKQDNFFYKERSSPRFIFGKSFPIFHRNLTQWRPLLSKGGRMIQVKIIDHPYIPLAQNKGFHLGGFFYRFFGS